MPSPDTFKYHFEDLLFTKEETNVDDIDISSSPYIPVLDDVINPQELSDCISEAKIIKANDKNGNTPGIAKYLTAELFIFILHLFNMIFQVAKFPLSWTISKLIVIFKKGQRLNCGCGNYRGIAINDIFFRLFDSILFKRLSAWYTPTHEQAGSQKGRNCMEHITQRLLIDCAKKNKSKLFILFVDFEMAYDKIVRTKLIEELKWLGCGMIMLKVIVAIYRNTSFLFNQIVINANRRVKQGSATSCFLFLIYVDCMVRKLK